MNWESFLKSQGKATPPSCEGDTCQAPPHPRWLPKTAIPKGSHMFVSVGEDGLRRNMIITEDGRTVPLDDYLNGFDNDPTETMIRDVIGEKESIYD